MTKPNPIGYVVRDVTGEMQLSTRFVLRSDARTFAEHCAMPVRVWRIVRKHRPRCAEPTGENTTCGLTVGHSGPHQPCEP